MGGVPVCPADLKYFNFEFALEFDDGVEYALHDMAIDEMALRFDNFRDNPVAYVHASLQDN
jgi:hypothetical protein